MNARFVSFVCRVLTASLIVLPWQAQAGLIGTDQALGAAQATVAAYVSRDDVAAQLQILGLSPQAANVRVAALTDAEVAQLAGGIDALPAGGTALLAAIVFCLVFYYLIIVPMTTEKAAPATGKAKPAPTPEKK